MRHWRGFTSAFTALAAALLALAGCRRPSMERVETAPTPEPTPTPTPTPEPTPIYVPYQKLETAKLFNGIELRTTLNSAPGANATTERENSDSYTLDLTLNVTVPVASRSIEALSRVTPKLPAVLPRLGSMLESARISPFFEDLYRRKLDRLQTNLPRLDRLLSRHNFYDCETILELQNTETGRRVLLLQSDMDVDMDGSDSDRVPYVDGAIPNYQPMTSYKWDKKTSNPNPFHAERLKKLQQYQQEYALKGLSAERNKELRGGIDALRYEVSQLASKSFLVSEYDPFVVISGAMFSRSKEAFTPRLGDYCLVIYDTTLYPAIVGDVGPSFKAGEASLRMAKEINARATPFNRPVSQLTATYLFFPGTAETPFGPPDYGRWTARCTELLAEIGGYQGTLHEWTNTIPPLPTPTPTPTPSATPNPTPTPTPTPTASPSPPASPAPSPSGNT